MSAPSPRWFALALAWTSACGEPSDSCISLAEDGVVLTAYVTDNGARVRAEIELRRDPDEIALRLCDKSSISVDGARAVHVRRPSGSSVYKADIETTADPNSRTITLEHEDGTERYSAAIDAPGFDISAPSAGTELSRLAPLELAWAPARPDALINARVDDVIDGETCLGAPILLDLPDEGAAVLVPGELQVAKESVPAVAECDAYVRLTRAVSAALAPTSGGASRLHPDSRVEASTSREIPFTSVP